MKSFIIVLLAGNSIHLSLSLGLQGWHWVMMTSSDSSQPLGALRPAASLAGAQGAVATAHGQSLPDFAVIPALFCL